MLKAPRYSASTLTLLRVLQQCLWDSKFHIPPVHAKQCMHQHACLTISCTHIYIIIAKNI